MNNKIELLKVKIAEELRKLRAEKKLSQDDVIKGIKKKHKESMINVGTLSRYENGSVLQNLDKLMVILDFYGSDILYFFNLVYENMYRTEEG